MYTCVCTRIFIYIKLGLSRDISRAWPNICICMKDVIYKLIFSVLFLLAHGVLLVNMCTLFIVVMKDVWRAVRGVCAHT